MAIELYTDKVPQYVFNKHTTYENTVLAEHAALLSDIKTNSIEDTVIESRSRLLVGMCLKQDAEQFIDNKFEEYYNREYNKLATFNRLGDNDKAKIAYPRAWINIINSAMAFFINKYKIDGSKAKIAVIDDELPDGRVIIDAEDPRVAMLQDIEKQYKELVKNIKESKPHFRKDDEAKPITKNDEPDPEENIEFTEDESGV